jgi:hypothetical protein
MLDTVAESTKSRLKPLEKLAAVARQEFIKWNAEKTITE